MNDDFILGRFLHDGGGEAGALMRSIDWSKTAVGPVSGWSQALRTMVGVLLRNRSPLILMWGPQFVQFYNDPYRPILGDKHPKAMGQAGPVCWAEIWHVIGPMFEAPFSGEPATWSDDLLLMLYRRGFIEETHFKVAYSPVPDESVQPTGVGGVLATVAEITEQVYGERQLRTLRELGARAADAKTPEDACHTAAATLGSSPRDVPFVLFYLLDDDGRLAHLAGSHGLRPGEHPAAPLTLDPSFADSSASVGWPIEHVLTERRIGVIANLDRRFEQLPVSDHGEAPHTAMALPLGSPDQPRVYGFFIVGLSPHRALDEGYRSFFEVAASQVVTAIRNARAYQEQLKRSEALAALDRSKSAFFSNVSHEFRTPLTLMLGPTEDALASPDGALRGEQLQTVHRNAIRLLKLVNALLDFSRIEGGRMLASYKPTDLSALTADLASAFRSAIERAGLRFEVNCPPLSEPVYVDGGMWEKVVLNLLSNALKFTFEGTISVLLLVHDGDVVLTVRDTGTGIPAAELPHLFERFHRVQGARARTHEGSGIGLALVHELVHLHGGTIEVDSTAGKGTAFSVRLRRGRAHLPEEQIEAASAASLALNSEPYVEEALRWLPEAAAAPDPAQPPQATRANAIEVSPSGGRILVVDDNADMRDYLRRALSQRWTVEVAADGKAALELARKTRPDLIVTDVMMPELDGFGLLRGVRSEASLAGTPVIMLSARAGDEARVEGIEAGADDYLVKPFSARELIARVTTHLELARLRTTGELERAKLSGLFMSAPAAVALLFGPRHIFQLANDQFLELTGKKNIVGRTVREAFPEMESQSYFELLDQVYRTGARSVQKEAKALLDRDGDGKLHELFVNFVYQPYFGADGGVEGISIFAFDVTEQVHARQAARTAQSEAESANRSKDEFLAILGHELRNPLAPILTALDLMRLRGDAVALKERAVIERQARHLARMVDDLLDVSRITSGKVTLRSEPIELSELIIRSIETAAPLLEQRRHELVTTVPKSGHIVDGDPERLVQVFSNLITNAAKYTDSGGRITIDARRDGDGFVLGISDTGRGISSEMLPHVFDLFSQEHQNLDRSQGGLGLGLSIVKSLVELHGGQVGAESAGLGRGSRFLVRLPVSGSVVVTSDDAPGTAPVAPLATEREARATILLVDDNEDAVDMLAELLSVMGYDTRIAHDGIEALNEAQRSAPPAAALLDIGLPGMDGYELARRLRALPGWQRVRLIAVTGYGLNTDRRNAKDAGFDEHLTKPIDLRLLEESLAPLKGTASRS